MRWRVAMTGGGCDDVADAASEDLCFVGEGGEATECHQKGRRKGEEREKEGVS